MSRADNMYAQVRTQAIKVNKKKHFQKYYQTKPMDDNVSLL
jgi:hypothetical protein